MNRIGPVTSWTAYRTQPQREEKAAKECAAAGIECCVPMEQRWRRVSSKTRNRKPFHVPMVRSYVIAKGDARASRFVTSRVGAVNNDEVKRLQALECTVAEPKERPGPMIGERVAIKVGPFADMIGIVKELRGTVALIGMKMFGADRTVSVSIYHLTRPPA